ncbi:imm11 family protein [Pannonibacter sp. SL95]|uniref:imm11 family protein n=1 Tax=Pannonibacter sp. SL95 TaxID=2995153 RepID=UPI0022763FA8|nr:DUF1629 domain-containing protein [Pannonibacter sp. SL95]MCY1707284.1 hypothetical protein [Pannonibacter sp. SL95]
MVYSVKLMFSDYSVPGFKFDMTREERQANADKYPAVGSSGFGWSGGIWKDPEFMPKSGYQASRGRVPDVFPMPASNAVHQRFKDLVEEFEPGVHQFFPLALRDKNGVPLPDPYYIFNCLVRLDAVLVAESGLSWGSEKIPEGRPESSISFDSQLVFSRPAIAGHHLWVGDYLWQHGKIYVSDAFYAELRARKIRFFRFAQYPELDIPWIAEEQIKPMLDWEASHEPEAWYSNTRSKIEVLEYRARLGL